MARTEVNRLAPGSTHAQAATSPGAGAIRRGKWMDVLLRCGMLVCLGIVAGVHLKLAPVYGLQSNDGIATGQLFLLQSLLCSVLGLGLFLPLLPALQRSGGKGSAAFRGLPAWTWRLAGVLSLGSLVAVVLSRSPGIPAVGPLPMMGPEGWYFEPQIAAVAAGVGVLLWLAWEIQHRQASRG